MRYLDKLERKFGKYAIKELVTKLAYIYSAVYIALLVFALAQPRVYYNIIDFMAFDISLVLKGQLWRVITFIFMPSFSPGLMQTLFLFFIIRFMIYIGNTLEYHWGTFRLNLYYLVGIVASIIFSSILTLSGVYEPIVNSGYLHSSIMLAFAFVAGETTIHLYGILPLKVKYFGYFTFAGLLFSTISGNLVAFAPILSFLLFFWKDIYYLLKNKKRSHDYRKNRGTTVFNANYEKPKVLHTCEVCGVTDVSDPNMEFRYCSKCEGLHEYCIKHINNHEHVRN